ncbi:helix-turn-helix transcriptional regulator [Roseospirillum parvum]|nr:LuxR family transcriptional regulator [Roseospirillum parvum]
MDKRITDFMTRLRQTSDFDQALTVATQGLENLGASTVVWWFGDPDNNNIWSTCPPSWFPYYFDQGYWLYDPLVRHCQSGVRPLVYGTEPAFTGQLHPRARQAFHETTEFGMHSGIQVPVRLGSGVASGGVNVGSHYSAPDLVRKFGEERLPVTHIMALLAHDHLAGLLGGTRVETEATLSPRQKEVLLWLAKGLNIEQIAERLGLTRITADIHIAKAREKLNAATREQALAIALRRGLITP